MKEPDGKPELMAKPPEVLEHTDEPPVVARLIVEIRSDGYRHGPAEVMQRLAAGERVDPSLYYFRTVLRFATASAEPGLARLNGLLGCAIGERQAGAVLLDVFVLG